MKPSLIMCTRNPKPSSIKSSINAILAQDYKNPFEIIVVDNNSTQKVESLFRKNKKIKWAFEKKPGLTSARLKGLQESKGDLLIYVDDDNVLSKNYLSTAIQLADQDPHTGVWSAEITGKFEVKPPPWAKMYLPFLALIDHSEEKWSDSPEGGTLPIGAGMVVRRRVMCAYAREVVRCPVRSILDRRPGTLMAGGDTDIGYTAIRLGYGCRYTRKLRLTHLIPRTRLEPDYLFQLAQDVTASHQILKRIHLKKCESSLDKAKAFVAKVASAFISPKGKRGLQIAILLGRREGNKKFKSLVEGREKGPAQKK